MKFIKEHWFAILFDVFLGLTLFFSNPKTLGNFFTEAFIILLCIGVQMIYHKIRHSVRRVFKKETASKDMKAHYEEQGLSEEETTFFRKTMAETKAQILTVEKEMEHNRQLSLINQQTKVITAAKGTFKELVKEPKKLHMMSEFLYTHLPNLVDLTSKYNEVCAHELKNERTKETLDQSLEAIRHLSLAIVNDYEKITSDDLLALSEGVDLARRNLSQHINYQEKER